MDYATLFGDAATTFTTNLGVIAPVAIGVGIAVLAVRRGWRWFKGLSQ